MSAFVRLFVALDIPESVGRSLAALVADLRKLSSSARWVNLEGVHVTLKFIGNVPAAQLEPIKEALEKVQPPPAFDLRFAGLGFFPNERRPRVFWAGINGQEELPRLAPKIPELSRLAASIEAALVPLGIPKEPRDFRAHLTLARFPESPRGPEITALGAAVARHAADDFGTARIEQFHLYQSILKSSGAEYTHLSSYPLHG